MINLLILSLLAAVWLLNVVGVPKAEGTCEEFSRDRGVSSGCTQCYVSEFSCLDGSGCLPKDKFCDGKSDCGDCSDEIPRNSPSPGIICRQNEFVCKLPNREKYKQRWFCTKRVDCVWNEFRCQDGSGCKTNNQFCDGYENCRDGSDEIPGNESLPGIKCRRDKYICNLPQGSRYRKDIFCKKNVSCSDGEFLCPDGFACLPLVYFCDGNKDCRSGGDEIAWNDTLEGELCRRDRHICKLPDKLTHMKAKFCRKSVNCTLDEFMCSDRSQCLPGTWFCDGKPDCKDKSDEVHPNESASAMSSCRRDRFICNLPLNQYHKEKELCLKDPNCTSDEFSCADKSQCVPASSFCDGVEDCGDGSDEIPFKTELREGFKKCKVFDSISGDPRVCQAPNDYDCRVCLSNDNNTRFLDGGCFRCLRNPNTVIPVEKLCNGKIDCPDISDECMCKSTKLKDICNKKIWGDYFSCTNSSQRIEGHRICDMTLDCSDGVDERFCGNRIYAERNGLKKKTHSCPGESKMATKCDGIAECSGGLEKEECESCENPPEYCQVLKFGAIVCNSRRGEIEVQGPDICDGKKNCRDWEDELNCTNKTHFYCGAKDGFPFVMAQKTDDGMPDCLNDSDETNCCFECLWDGKTKYIGLDQLCDDAQDCDDGHDECLPDCIPSRISSNRSLIRDKPVLASLFAIATCAVGGNLFVISTNIRKAIYRNKKSSRHGDRRQKRRKKINRALLFSLSISDFLVGLYVLSICVVSVVTDGNYCGADRDWRSGITCSVLGAVLLTGSEQSVQTLVLITISRWHSVRRIFGEAPVNKFMTAIAVTWMTSITIATIPLMPFFEDTFTTSIWYANNKIFGKITQNEVKNINMWLSTMETNYSIDYQGDMESWSTLKYLIGDLNPDLIVGREYGFYSSHTVCIPNLFPDRKNVASWRYSIMIIALNFIAFIAIVLFSILMYREANQTSKVRNSAKRSKQASRMQKRLTAIVVTDFLCWIPVCILAFSQLARPFISDDYRLIVGMVILPINSSLNPFIYTDLPQKALSKFMQLFYGIRILFVAVIRMVQGCTKDNDNNEAQVKEGGEQEEIEYIRGVPFSVVYSSEGSLKHKEEKEGLVEETMGQEIILHPISRRRVSRKDKSVNFS